MNHTFNVDVATEYGLEEAILLENLYFWCKKNEANGKLKDGKPWTYNSVRAFNILFPYISPAKITRALKTLEENGLIEVGQYSYHAYNKTKWYCVTDKARRYYEKVTENKPIEKQENKSKKKLISAHPKKCEYCGAKLVDNSGTMSSWFCRNCEKEWQIKNDKWQEI